MTSRPAPTPAPAPRLRQEVSALRGRLRRLAAHFWLVPATWCTIAVIAGALLPSLDGSGTAWAPVLFPGGPDGARSVLSTIAGAMISVTGLVFSITIVVLQLASSQFTPRVLRTFLDRRITQHTLGVFAASFLYALTVLRSIEGSSESGGAESVPHLAVTAGYLLVLAAVGMFLAFIHDVTRSIDVSTIMRQVGAETRAVLDSSFEHRALLAVGPVDLPDLDGQSVATAARSGYLDRLDTVGLTRAAADQDVRVEMLHPLGTFVPAGAPLSLVHGTRGRDGDWDGLVAAHVTLASERSSEQDLSWGLRRLVDIADRALSPGTNDPTTAVQVIDQLHDLLRRMAARPDVDPVHLDPAGVPRLVSAEHTFDDHLRLAVDEIAHWGADSVQVPRRLRLMLDDLGAVATAEHLPAIRSAAARVDAEASHADRAGSDTGSSTGSPTGSQKVSR